MYAQNWNVGGSVGKISSDEPYEFESFPTFDARITYKPENGFFSFNAEPGIVWDGEDARFQSNLYFAFDFGKKKALAKEGLHFFMRTYLIFYTDQ